MSIVTEKQFLTEEELQTLQQILFLFMKNVLQILRIQMHLMML